VTAAVTLLPGVGGDFAALPDGGPWFTLFLEPGHYTPMGVEEAPGEEWVRLVMSL